MIIINVVIEVAVTVRSAKIIQSTKNDHQKSNNGNYIKRKQEE